MPAGLSLLTSVVQMVTNNFSSLESVEEIERFFKDKNTKGFNQGLAQSLDSVRAKANWIERDGQDVRSWLSDRGYFMAKL